MREGSHCVIIWLSSPLAASARNSAEATMKPIHYACAPLLAGLLSLGGSCTQVSSLGSGGGITELYIQNDTGQDLRVSYEMSEEASSPDGEKDAPAGERTWVVEEVASGPLLPSDILASIRVTTADGSTTLLELDEIDDEEWVPLESNSRVHSEFELVIVEQ
jgi:hypothetical protein